MLYFHWANARTNLGPTLFKHSSNIRFALFSQCYNVQTQHWSNVRATFKKIFKIYYKCWSKLSKHLPIFKILLNIGPMYIQHWSKLGKHSPVFKILFNIGPLYTQHWSKLGKHSQIFKILFNIGPMYTQHRTKVGPIKLPMHQYLSKVGPILS